jgi:ubiquinone/menaquinone biosynthesis C-methylase UbiE
LASFATDLIDAVAYNGEDIRRRVLEERISSSDSVVDLCCGIGKSTLDMGVDSSEEMIAVAKGRASNTSFSVGNAETFGETGMADVCTIFFSLHEMPRVARKRVVDNALRLARKKVVVLDISPSYLPSQSMLFGEPYLLDYLDNIREDLKGFDEEVVVEEHANLWLKEK